MIKQPVAKTESVEQQKHSREVPNITYIPTSGYSQHLFPRPSHSWRVQSPHLLLHGRWLTGRNVRKNPAQQSAVHMWWTTFKRYSPLQVVPRCWWNTKILTRNTCKEGRQYSEFFWWVLFMKTFPRHVNNKLAHLTILGGKGICLQCDSHSSPSSLLLKKPLKKVSWWEWHHGAKLIYATTTNCLQTSGLYFS